MTKAHIFLSTLLCFVVITSDTCLSQTAKKQKLFLSHAAKNSNSSVDSLTKPTNDKVETSESKTRYGVYGLDSSNVIIDNYTNYTIDIYVDGKYWGTIAPWDMRTTWVVPGATKLYAKATFNDGTYYYWGPSVVLNSYEYTWQLHY